MKGFNDATHVYTKYLRRNRGFVILGPPASGKTTFVKKQISPSYWIDQDDLFGELNVDWYYMEDDPVHAKLNYLRADYISEQSKLLGYSIIGSLYWEYKADAIVIPVLELHKQYISKRIDLNLENVMKIREHLIHHAEKNNIPIFTDCDSAVDFCKQ